MPVILMAGPNISDNRNNKKTDRNYNRNTSVFLPRYDVKKPSIHSYIEHGISIYHCIPSNNIRNNKQRQKMEHAKTICSTTTNLLDNIITNNTLRAICKPRQMVQNRKKINRWAPSSGFSRCIKTDR